MPSVNDTRELRELERIHRKATRMFSRRNFRKAPTILRYRPPSAKTPKALLNECRDCGRPSQGWHCRECYTRKAFLWHAALVRADDERVRMNEAAYLNVIQKEMTMATNRKTKNALAKTPITRSTSGLRTALFEEMEALRRGDSNAQRARSVAMMANSILQSVQVEIEYHKYVNANQGKVVGDTKVVPLGTDISLAA